MFNVVCDWIEQNRILSLSKIIDYSDCAIPFENQALYKIAQRVQEAKAGSVAASVTANADKSSASLGLKPQAFDEMNNIVANFILNLTRFVRQNVLRIFQCRL